MQKVLLINPNTNSGMTEKMLFALRNESPDLNWQGQTARFGSPYIACETSYAIATHATVDAWAANEPAHAILIGCFGDPGLFALRERAGVPVTGLAEAAFTEAAKFGRFSIITGGLAWGPMLKRLSLSLGFSEALSGITTVKASGAELAANPDRALEILDTAIQESISDFAPHAVIMGGAGLVGFAEKLQSAHQIPLIDSVQAGCRVISSMLTQPQNSQQPSSPLAVTGISEEMQRRLG